MKLMLEFADKDFKTDIINMIKNLKKRNTAENLKQIWELWTRILTNSEKFKYKISDMKKLQEKQNDQQIWIQINRNYSNWVNGKKSGKKTTETHSVTWGIKCDIPAIGFSKGKKREKEKIEAILGSKFSKFDDKWEFTDPRRPVTPKEDKYKEPHIGIS